MVWSREDSNLLIDSPAKSFSRIPSPSFMPSSSAPSTSMDPQQRPQQPQLRPTPSTASSSSASTSASPPSASPPPLSARPLSPSTDDDEINRELVRLEHLRLNVKQNLTLRPLGTTSSGSTLSVNPSSSTADGTLSLNSNLDSHPPTAIRRTFQGLPLTLKSDSLASNGMTDSSGDTASTGTMSTPQSPSSSNSSETSPVLLYTALSPSTSHINALPLPAALHSPSDIISHYAEGDAEDHTPAYHRLSPVVGGSSSSLAQPLSPTALLAWLTKPGLTSAQPQSRPLLLDTRPTGDYLHQNVSGSINLAIPTLILKRWKKYLEKDHNSTASSPKGGQGLLVQAIGETVQGLQGFVTTEDGKVEWEKLLGPPGDASTGGGSWNGDIVVFDDEMDESDPLAPNAVFANPSVPPKPPIPSHHPTLPPSSTPTTSWLLISILSSLASSNVSGKSPKRVFWLRGGFAAVRRDAGALVSGSGRTSQDALNEGVQDLSNNKGQSQAVYTSSPTEIDAPPLPASARSVAQPSTAQKPLLSLPAIQSPTSSAARQRAVSTSILPSPSSESMGGSGGATVSGFKARVGGVGGLLSLKTDLPRGGRSKSKQRTVVAVSEESPVVEKGQGGMKEKVVGLGGGSSTPPSHDGSLAPPSRHGSNSSTNESRTPTMASSSISSTAAVTANKHSPLPMRKPSPINRIIGGGSGQSYNYSSMYSEASPSPSPSTTTGNLPFPRTPTAMGMGGGVGTGSGGSSTASATSFGGSTVPSPGVGGGGFLRGRSNTAMLPRLAKLDTKTSRERLTPINTSFGSSKTQQAPPPPPLPNNTTTNNSNTNPSTTTTTTTAGDNTESQEQQPGMPPKLSLRMPPLKAATLAAPIASPKVSGFGLKLNLPPSPNRAAFSNNVTSPTQDWKSPLSGTSVYFSPVQTPSEVARQYPFTPVESTYHSAMTFGGGSGNYQSFALAPPQQGPSSPTTPQTARPPPSPAMSSALTSESESAVPPFIISTIVPGFLYLGPEMSSEENLEELLSYGVKRVLNMAFECEPDDYGLDLEKRFEKYNQIPMRDTVEEDRMSKALKEVCELLDDARLHSAPTYVHCKAGKSRSVTAVMAYLIHANHWTLSQAYKYVVDRRKGVSPNIGFVSELMNFEEQKLGTKSIGVAAPDMATSASADAATMSHHHASSSAAPPPSISRVRAAHARDSLPPGALFHHSQSMADGMSQIGVPVTAGGLGGAAVGAGAGEEMEVKDEEGRYRHARRAPKDEATLQPMRRVSKAGLESAFV